MIKFRESRIKTIPRITLFTAVLVPFLVLLYGSIVSSERVGVKLVVGVISLVCSLGMIFVLYQLLIPIVQRTARITLDEDALTIRIPEVRMSEEKFSLHTDGGRMATAGRIIQGSVEVSFARPEIKQLMFMPTFKYGSFLTRSKAQRNLLAVWLTKEGLRKLPNAYSGSGPVYVPLNFLNASPAKIVSAVEKWFGSPIPSDRDPAYEAPKKQGSPAAFIRESLKQPKLDNLTETHVEELLAIRDRLSPENAGDEELAQLKAIQEFVGTYPEFPKRQLEWVFAHEATWRSEP